MTPQEPSLALLAALMEHLRLPEGYQWVLMATLIAVTFCGLILLLRGAKWAPGFAALTFLGIGSLAGSFLGRAIGTPYWPTVGIVGILGFVAGLVMFRFWQAILLAGCFALAGLSVYYVRSLTPEVQNWLSASSEPGLVTLQPAGTVIGENRPSATARLGSLWTHLGQNVPHFTTTFWVLVVSTALAGLVFGVLLPYASRALWAASLGTLLCGIGGAALIKHFAPNALEWLLANNSPAWIIVGVVWLLSFVLNLATCRRKRHKKPDDGDPRPQSKPAVA